MSNSRVSNLFPLSKQIVPSHPYICQPSLCCATVWLVLLRTIDINNRLSLTALHAPDDQGDPEGDLEEDTDSDTCETSIPERAGGRAVVVGDVAEVVGVGYALIICFLACPGTEENATDDEEEGGETEAADRPALAHAAFLLDDLLLVCHLGDV